MTGLSRFSPGRSLGALTLLLVLGLSPGLAAQEQAPASDDTEVAAEAAPQEAPVAPILVPEPEPESQEVDETRAGYDELVAQQGNYAYAFDFFTISMLWTVLAAALVFLMHLGFACVESGLTQSKNTVNILFKNMSIVSIGLLTYAIWGFASHYPGDFNGFFSAGSPIGDLNADGGGTFGYGGVGLAMTGYGDFLFQAMFAATGATIVSGVVAERVKLLPFLIFVTLLVGFAYPWIGSWHWGGGWMSNLNGGNGFKDFAGSAMVHAFGGFAGLGCVMLLGPRKGKYGNGGRPIQGHNMALAMIGVFLLWFGWYGFNGGSVLSAAPGPLGLVFTTTSLAAAAGGISAASVSWLFLRKPDLSMGLNGILGGLVGITANADIVSAMGAIGIGLIAGAIVVGSVLFFDRLKIDDPVGAISVHGMCGVWGILAAAIFDVTNGGYTVLGQFIGVVAVGGAAFLFSLVVFGIIKAAMGVRVTEAEEVEGLDISEHGMEAYPHFQVARK
jgi:Amt family ammonium transporter